MTADIPAPLTPPDCDCTDLDGFMLNVERLMASELVALSSHEVVGAALFLWCRAWKQRPAASLPDDERVLAAYAKLPLPRFRKLRTEIMKGFDKCTDGRYYHRVLAPEAVKAYERKLAFQKSRVADAERLRKWRLSRSETPKETDGETANETTAETRFVREGQDRTGQVVKKEKVAATSFSSRDLAPAVLFCAELGLRLEGDPKRFEWPSQIAKWLEDHGRIEDLIEAAKRSKARGDGGKPLKWYFAIALDVKQEREKMADGKTAEARRERMEWLKVYPIDGRWKDVLGVGPAPHEPGTLVTDADLGLVPGAREKRDQILRGAEEIPTCLDRRREATTAAHA